MFERSIRFRDRSISWIRFRDRSINIDDISKPSISNIWIIFLYISLLFWLNLVKNHGKCLISKVIDRIKMVQFRHFIQFVGHFTIVLSQNGQKCLFSKKITFRDYLVSLSLSLRNQLWQSLFRNLSHVHMYRNLKLRTTSARCARSGGKSKNLCN